MSGSTSGAPQRTSLDSALEILKHLSVNGLPLVLWTVIVCAALVKADAKTLERIWPDLFAWWKYLLAFWVAGAALAVAFRSFTEGKKPVVAETSELRRIGEKSG